MLGFSVKTLCWDSVSRLYAGIQCQDSMLGLSVKNLCQDSMLGLSVKTLCWDSILRLSVETLYALNVETIYVPILIFVVENNPACLVLKGQCCYCPDESFGILSRSKDGNGPNENPYTLRNGQIGPA